MYLFTQYTDGFIGVTGASSSDAGFAAAENAGSTPVTISKKTATKPRI
jgi:hypothetical protein